MVKVVPFTGINANRGASGGNEVGAVVGREGVKRGLLSFLKLQ